MVLLWYTWLSDYSLDIMVLMVLLWCTWLSDYSLDIMVLLWCTNIYLEPESVHGCT